MDAMNDEKPESARAESKPAIPLAEWQEAMARRGKIDAKFRCPFCGHEASARDWKDASGDPQRAPQECIGRLIGAKGGLHREREQPCDWAAFGLFGTLDGGTKILLPEGREIWVFEFAESDEDLDRRDAYDRWKKSGDSDMGDLDLRAAAQHAQRVGDGAAERQIDDRLTVRGQQ